jgi:hypothetical protein
MNIADIEQEARDLCDADTTSYPAATMLRRVNNAYEQVVGWLINADGKWQFDDTNYTNFPIGTYTMVDSQGVYSFNDKFLQIEDVQVKNSDGNFQIIKPLDQKDSNTLTPLREEFEDDGLPIYYDKLTDDTIELLPAPATADVTLASGLRIKFKRTASIFTSAEVTTGTKVPGFHSTFHVILAYMAAIPYCMTYKPERVAYYEREVERLKKAMIKQYTKRAKDERKIIKPKKILHI